MPPVIVNVLPEPVLPYANTVPLMPSNAEVTTRAATPWNTCGQTWPRDTRPSAAELACTLQAACLSAHLLLSGVWQEEVAEVEDVAL